MLLSKIIKILNSLRFVSRYRDPQPQVVENYSHLFNLRPNIHKIWCLNSHLIPNNDELIC